MNRFSGLNIWSDYNCEIFISILSSEVKVHLIKLNFYLEHVDINVEC